MKVGKQLGADIMTERIIKEINTEKQLLAEAKPVNIAEWDAALCAELDSQTEPKRPHPTTTWKCRRHPQNKANNQTKRPHRRERRKPRREDVRQPQQAPENKRKKTCPKHPL